MNSSVSVAVIGLGYVGLPLAIALARRFPTVGYDIDSSRISELKAGQDRTGEVTSEAMLSSNLSLSDELKTTEAAQIYIVTVPTPVDGENRPDLSIIKNACISIGNVLRDGNIVVFESTVYPGVTEDICGPALAEASGLQCGKDFFLGYSPERINPGDREHTVDKITKVVAGQTPIVLEKLSWLYGEITSGGVYQAQNIKTAEAAKVIENAQRDINIAFVNEVAAICQKLSLSAREVLEAAGTKWNFLPFTPGLVGGHCIGVDPFYLAHQAQQVGYDPQIILAGRRLNDAMGEFIAGCIDEHMARPGRVLILGLTFKENVPDLRNSKVVDVVSGLRAKGHEVFVHDAVANAEEAERLFGLPLYRSLEDEGNFDALVGAVRHDDYLNLDKNKISRLVREEGLIADIKGLWRKENLPKNRIYWQL